MEIKPDPNMEILKVLSGYLGQNIYKAEQEVRRSKEQLDSLMFTKGLVDESVKVLGSYAGYQSTAQITIFPTGSMLLPISEQFNNTPPGSGRSFITDQMQSSMQAAVSAFVVAFPRENQAELESLRQRLQTHNEELVSLEDRLSSRLEIYSAHLPTILHAALESYRDAGNPARFVNTGNLLRELQREFLEVVAPDELVIHAPWFVYDNTSKNGVTRRHRINYAIFGNLTTDKFPGTFTEQADENASALLKDIGKLSAFTHVTGDILEKTYVEAAPVFAGAMQRFLLLVSAVESAKILVEKDIAEEIQPHLDDLFSADFFDELDCLSTHTRPQGASDVEVHKITFDEDWIKFKGSGSVDCDLQWGSDGDVSRGDGLEGSDSYPFTFAGRAQIGDLSKIEIFRSSIEIDTSSDDEPEPEE